MGKMQINQLILLIACSNALIIQVICYAAYRIMKCECWCFNAQRRRWRRIELQEFMWEKTRIQTTFFCWYRSLLHKSQCHQKRFVIDFIFFHLISLEQLYFTWLFHNFFLSFYLENCKQNNIWFIIRLQSTISRSIQWNVTMWFYKKSVCSLVLYRSSAQHGNCTIVYFPTIHNLNETHWIGKRFFLWT